MECVIHLSKIRKVAYQAGYHCPCQASEVFCLLLQGLTNEQIMSLMRNKYAQHHKRWNSKSEKKKFLYFLRCYVAEYHCQEFLKHAAANNWTNVTHDLDCSDKKYHELRKYLIKFLRDVAGLRPPFHIEVDDWILSPRGLILQGGMGNPKDKP